MDPQHAPDRGHDPGGLSLSLAACRYHDPHDPLFDDRIDGETREQTTSGALNHWQGRPFFVQRTFVHRPQRWVTKAASDLLIATVVGPDAKWLAMMSDSLAVLLNRAQ